MFDSVNWFDLFVPHVPLLETFVRGTAIYLGLFVLLRVILKRESGTLGTTDMLLVVLIADAAQNGMAADYRSITEGLLLVGVILFWSYALNWLGYRVAWLEKLIKPAPLLLVKDGQMLKDNMRKELITAGELLSEARLHGLADLSTIREAYMEPSGRISIVSREQPPSPPSDAPPR